MVSTRREFLKLTAVSGAAATLSGREHVMQFADAPELAVRQPRMGGLSPVAEGHTVTLPTGATLFYEVQGAGRPLLLLHGGPGLDHTSFQPWLEPLARHMRLIYLDLRGNGRSPELPATEYTHEKVVQDLHALRQALGIEQWAVLGHSYGGFLAQLYALAYPDTISYLILLDTSPAPLQLGNAEGIQLVSGKFTPERVAALGTFSTAAFGSDDEWTRVWQAILPLFFHDYDVESLIAADRTVYRASVARQMLAHELPAFDTRAHLLRLAMPTLVGVGRKDWIMTVRHSQVLYKGIPGAEMAVFDRSGHFPFIEEQEGFLDTMRTFLGV